jgi:hypothetical protein
MMHKALPILLLSLCACGDRAEMPAGDDTANAPAVESTAPAQPSGEVPGPISSRGQAVPSGGAADSQQGAGLDFDMPQGWTDEPPSSSMRMAQATIPGPGGPGSLAVFFFGPGGGGGVEANIQRWIEQVEVSGQPKQETFETANGYRVTWVDVAGTVKPSMMGTGPTEPQPNSRLLGAVVEGPGGPWFFKATGPEATLTPQREAFLGMVRSVRPES